MKSASNWTHLRLGVLTVAPKAGSLEERVRIGSFEDFIRMVQEDAIDKGALPTPMERALAEVEIELHASMARFKPMNSAHEGYAVILEEMDELWDEIKVNQSKRDYAKMEKECIQVAAMAVRLLLDVVRDPKRGHEKVVESLYDRTHPTTTRPSFVRPPDAPDDTIMEGLADTMAKQNEALLAKRAACAHSYARPLPRVCIHCGYEDKPVARNLGMATYRERPAGFVHGVACAYRLNTGDCDCAFFSGTADPKPTGGRMGPDGIMTAEVRGEGKGTAYRTAPPGTSLDASLINHVCVYCGNLGATMTTHEGKWIHAGTCP